MEIYTAIFQKVHLNGIKRHNSLAGIHSLVYDDSTICGNNNENACLVQVIAASSGRQQVSNYIKPDQF